MLSFVNIHRSVHCQGSRGVWRHLCQAHLSQWLLEFTCLQMIVTGLLSSRALLYVVQFYMCIIVICSRWIMLLYFLLQWWGFSRFSVDFYHAVAFIRECMHDIDIGFPPMLKNAVNPNQPATSVRDALVLNQMTQPTVKILSLLGCLIFLVFQPIIHCYEIMWASNTGWLWKVARLSANKSLYLWNSVS